MTVLSILISTIVAVAVVLVLRSMDRENNSMNKVKHYTDSRINQIDEYFSSRSSNLDALSADLETHQTSAIAAVNRLEKQIEEFKLMSRSFEEQFAKVDNISKKIDEYGHALGELMDMTDRVEENLVAVKKESVVVEKLNSKINEKAKAVESLEKKIPLIIQEFKNKNNDSLKLIGAEMLNQFNARAAQLEPL